MEKKKMSKYDLMVLLVSLLDFVRHSKNKKEIESHIEMLIGSIKRK